jgi:hypothetical protein
MSKWCTIDKKWVEACNHTECGPNENTGMVHCFVEHKDVYSCLHAECIQRREKDDHEKVA